MREHDGSEGQRRLVRALRVGLVVLLAGGALAIGLLALGVADPVPPGRLRWERIAAPMGCLALDDLELPGLETPGAISVEAAVTTLPAGLTAWGVWLEAPDGPWRWEVLPPGHYRHAGQTVAFPHVRDGINALRLDVTAETVTLWLNRERVMRVEAALGPAFPWGIDTPQGVCVNRIAVFGPT